MEKNLSQLADELILLTKSQAISLVSKSVTTAHQAVELLNLLNQRYYNVSDTKKQSILSNLVYDSIQKSLEKKFNMQYKRIGAVEVDKVVSQKSSSNNNKIVLKKTILPYYMGSLNKIRPYYKTNSSKELQVDKDEMKLLQKFFQEYPIQDAESLIESDKIDGVSVEVFFDQEEEEDKKSNPRMFTRGAKGIVGVEISHFVPHLIWPKGFLNKIKEHKVHCIRAELVYKKVIFEKLQKNPPPELLASGSSTTLGDARSTIAGQLRTCVIPMIKSMSIIAYKICFIPGKNIKPMKRWDQFEFLSKILGFEIPRPVEITKSHLSAEQLEENTVKRKQTSEYQIDGLVYATNVLLDDNDESNTYQPRSLELVDDLVEKNINKSTDVENPVDMFAYKAVDESIEAKVKNVLWTISRYGNFFPTIQIYPIFLDNVTISNFSGKSASFIVDNVIAKGSIILATRSGGVIPDVVDIIQLAPSGEAELPDPLKYPYKWNDTHENLKLIDPEACEEVHIQRLFHLFKSLSASGLGEETARKLWDNFKPDALNKILDATMEDFQAMDGFQKKSAQNLFNMVQKCLNNVSLIDLMYGSSLFQEGFGRTRFKEILKNFPDVLSWEVKNESELMKQRWIDKIQNLHGFDIFAYRFVENLPRFQDWLKKHPKLSQMINQTKPTRVCDEKVNTSMKDQVVVFTGFTASAQLEKIICSFGGVVKQKFSGTTTVLVCKQLGKMTTKEKSAIAHNSKPKNSNKLVRITNLEGFLLEFGIDVSATSEM